MRKPLTMSPCRAHYLRSAAKATAQASESPAPAEANTAYDLMLAKLHTDERALKGIQSIQARIELKRKLLPDYAPWIEGILSAGAEAPDRIVTTIMLWRIDAGDFTGALDIAEYALKHNIPMPDRFKRDLPTVLVEEVAESALRDLKAGNTPDAAPLHRTAQLTAEHDMPDPVRAKLLKAVGLTLEPADPESALRQLQQAVLVHEGVGVKKDIERIQRTLKNQRPQ